MLPLYPPSHPYLPPPPAEAVATTFGCPPVFVDTCRPPPPPTTPVSPCPLCSYNSATLRALNILVEASDHKHPPQVWQMLTMVLMLMLIQERLACSSFLFECGLCCRSLLGGAKETLSKLRNGRPSSCRVVSKYLRLFSCVFCALDGTCDPYGIGRSLTSDSPPCFPSWLSISNETF